MSWYIILAWVWGGLIWYLFFYLRFKHKDTINELRSNLKVANKEIEYLSNELEEFTQQNAILKEKITELLEKNDDLSDVVSELSKYYVHIKKAAEKTTELTKFLHTPNPEIEEKMQPYLKQSENTKHETDHKKFF